MKRRLISLAVLTFLLAFASTALASGLWTKVASNVFAVKAYFSSGTGTVPTDRNPDGGVIAGLNASGLPLARQTGLSVTVETLTGVDGGTISAGTLQAYLYDESAGRWARAPDLDLTTTAGLSAQSFTGFRVTQQRGRIAYVPSGLGQPVNVYITGTNP